MSAAVTSDPVPVCNTCHGPVFPKTRLQLVLDSLAYDLWMSLPKRMAFSRPGFVILGFAGSHAYSCTCPNKVLDQ